MRKTPVVITSALALLAVVAFAGPDSATPSGALIWARRKRA